MKARVKAKFPTNAILKKIEKAREFLDTRDRIVLVGIPGNDQQPTGESTAGIARVHEFGSPKKNIPERSFLRAGIRAANEELIALSKRDMKKVVRGKMTMTMAMNRLGVMAVGQVQKYIGQSENFAPLSARTIAEKGSDKPLIDTGNMRQSITYVVEVKKK